MENAVFDTTAVDVIAAVASGEGKGEGDLPPAGHRVAAALRRLPQGAGRLRRRRGLPALSSPAERRRAPGSREGHPRAALHPAPPTPKRPDQGPGRGGIGRPSTYAFILSTIQDRGYVEKIEKAMRPTELGTIVNNLLVEHF